MLQNPQKSTVRPKKHLGQHFLRDQNIAAKIAASLELIEGHCIIEIGPGTGVLTQFIADDIKGKDISYKLVEFDQESVLYLNNIDAYKTERISIIQGDILRYDWKLPQKKLDLIGNLPYNISSPIFFRVLDYLEIVNSGVFMVQKEVADRICSKHGNKTYGILSVLIQAYFDCEMLFDVAPGAFYPPPKVYSSVFRIKRRANAPKEDLKSTLKTIVKKSFNQRRKMLRNTIGVELKELGGEVEKYLTLRPEQLSVEEFIFIAERIEG